MPGCGPSAGPAEHFRASRPVNAVSASDRRQIAPPMWPSSVNGPGDLNRQLPRLRRSEG
jgi:hypothetical protein